MAERDTATKSTRRSAKSRQAQGTPRFTDDELAAMKDHAQELKAAARRGSRATKEDGERDLLAKVAEMQEKDRLMAERVHALIKEVAPDLAPTTWYGMPAYAKDGKAVCFFQSAQKFKSRYAMLGFSDKANLDDGDIWPVYFALRELTPSSEKKIAEIVRQAVS